MDRPIDNPGEQFMEFFLTGAEERFEFFFVTPLRFRLSERFF